MDTSALVASLTSVMAIGLALVTARLLRQDRQRSDARVTMLATLAAAPSFAHPSFAHPAFDAHASFDAPPVRLEPRVRPRQAPAHPAPRAPRAVAVAAAEIEIFREAPAAGVAAPDLFEPARARTGISLIYIFAGAVIAAALIALAFRWALPAPPATADTIATMAAPAAPQPLALVSLRHEQQADGTLVISGVVRNLPGSAARERLFAAASLLDAEGAVIATARSPLDFTSLAPGDESPFVVRVTGAAGVARYRVGFRDAAGASVAHVDQR